MKFKNFLMPMFILIVSVMVLAAGCSSAKPSSQESSPTDTSASTQAPKSALDGYPDKPINVLVGYAPGGGSDIQSRTIIKIITENKIVDQTFQVENLPGASGVQAFTKMFKEKDNKYQLLNVPEMGIPLMNGALDATYDDFQPVAQVGTSTLVIAVKADSRFKTIEQLLEEIQNDPQSVSIAVPGALDSAEPYRWYTIFEELAKKSGKKPLEIGSLNIVPTDGSAAVVTNVLGGHLDVALVDPNVFVDHVKTGNARVLAVLSPERLPQFPEAPTLVEKGINIVHSKARGFWIGKDVPKEIVQYWEDKLREVTKTPEYKEYADKNLMQITFLNSEEYTKFLKEEGPRFKAYIQKVQANR